MYNAQKSKDYGQAKAAGSIANTGEDAGLRKSLVVLVNEQR